MKNHIHMTSCSGAALTETIILMLALIPIMLGIPMVGKLIDLRQTTVQASRYAAWEATVSPTAVAPTDLKARFFSDDKVAIGGDASAPNALWGGNRHGETAPESEERTHTPFMSSDHTAVKLDENTGAALPYISAYGAGANGDAALVIQQMVEKAGNISADVTGGEWMDSGSLQGMLRSEVRADVEGNGLFETLSFDDATVIMSDNWSSEDDAEAAARARAMVPAGALENIGNLFSEFGNFPMFNELKDLDGAFGHVDMNPLPAGESPFVQGARIQRRPLKPYEGD